MGSLRNPIGPLPSSIYWRRRVVALAIAALLILVTLLIVNSCGAAGSGDDLDNQANRDRSNDPASSITPGPTDDPSATISERPGGREEVGDSEGSGADEGADGGDSTGSNGSSGGSGGSGSGSGGSSGGGASGGTGGIRIPAGTGLPVCSSGTATVVVSSSADSYRSGQKPKITLSVRNTSGDACQVDFGATKAVITVTDVDGNVVWSSDHCPADRDALLTKVPAGSQAPHTVTWDRERSAAKCATPPAGAVSAGTYRVEADLGGGLTDETSFVLTPRT